MSKASTLRDAVVTELEAEFPSYTVEAFIWPHWTREQLLTGPRVAVRIGGRQVQLGHGIDQTDVTIEVGVVGVMPEGSSATGYDELARDKCDEFDGMIEALMALWINGGRLSKSDVGDHYPVAIEQVIQFDPEQLYQKGVYLSMFQITYRDSEDE